MFANHDVIQRSRNVETELALSQIVVTVRRDTSSGVTHASQFVIQRVSTQNVRNQIPAHASKDSTKVQNQMFVNPSATKDAPTEPALLQTPVPVCMDINRLKQPRIRVNQAVIPSSLIPTMDNALLRMFCGVTKDTN
uniref:(northern house mosquito) hypothetical protein n=1 Tax=Culex pipiens TaxID=7175 RepID=A0A8D8ATI6_CULPI